MSPVGYDVSLRVGKGSNGLSWCQVGEAGAGGYLNYWRSEVGAPAGDRGWLMSGLVNRKLVEVFEWLSG